jgi:hypothetical protein
MACIATMAQPCMPSSRHAESGAWDPKRGSCKGFSQGWEAVGRLRTSAGIEVERYTGSLYRRNTTDVEFPALSADSAFGAVLRLESSLPASRPALLQFALLYSTPGGERRIRRARAATLSVRSGGVQELCPSHLSKSCSPLKRARVAAWARLGAARGRLQIACCRKVVRVNAALGDAGCTRWRCR